MQQEWTGKLNDYTRRIHTCSAVWMKWCKLTNDPEHTSCVFEHVSDDGSPPVRFDLNNLGDDTVYQIRNQVFVNKANQAYGELVKLWDELGLYVDSVRDDLLHAGRDDEEPLTEHLLDDGI